MGEGRVCAVIAALLSLAVVGCLQSLAPDGKIPRMTKEELRSLLGNSDAIVVDVRLESEWKETEWKIKGAVREDPEKDIKTWADKFPKDKTLIFYCSWPNGSKRCQVLKCEFSTPFS